MLSTIRSIFSNSWVARILAALLAVSFGAWGIQGALFGNGGGPTASDAVSLRGGAVGLDDFENAYEHGLQDAAQNIAQQNGQPAAQADPSTLSPEIRQEVGQQVLSRLVTTEALVLQAKRFGLTVPDDMIRQSVYAIGAFKGTDGNFDRAKFNQVLAANHLTEAKVLAIVRDEILTRGVIDPIRSGLVVPDIVPATLFAYAAETRSVDLATVPFAAMPAPAAPDEAVLRRFYANHPKLFATPELRHIRLVVLSPETVGRDQPVSEAEIRAAYDRDAATLVKPPRRSAEVVTVGDAAKGRAIAAAWQGGATWPVVQAMAAKAGGTAVALPNAAEREFPLPALGRAVFAATGGDVTGPVQDEAGWVVLRVVGSEAGSGDYASEHDRIRDRIASARASSMISDRVDRLQDAIAGGGLDKIPGDLGAEAAEGTLDASGNTAEGDPAPLPASGALRDAIVAKAFSTPKGTPPTLVQGPGNGWYALEVEGVTPPGRKSFDDARADVARLWRQDAIEREANEKAATMFAAAKAARSLQAAAAAGDEAVQNPAPFRRAGPATGVPQALQQVAFGLNPGDATMVETPDGFTVAVVTAIGHPGPDTDRAGYDRLRTEITQSMQSDMELAYASVVTRDAKPQPNGAAIRRVLGQ